MASPRVQRTARVLEEEVLLQLESMQSQSEAGMAVQALRQASIPPTVALKEPDPEAIGWVSSEPRPAAGSYALCVNAGFGGINAAICLKKRD